MTDQEVNKIIAEFMGREIVKRGYCWFLLDCMCELTSVYTESLDALVPAWEKLKLRQIKIGDSFGIEQCTLFKGIETGVWSDGETIQQAAAHATAKAIQEIDASI
jgi:hypothetical protein